MFNALQEEVSVNTLRAFNSFDDCIQVPTSANTRQKSMSTRPALGVMNGPVFSFFRFIEVMEVCLHEIA